MSRMALGMALIAIAVLVGATGPAVAHPNAGASGNCDADTTQGDGPAVEVSQWPNLVTPGEVQQTVSELAYYATNNPQNNDSCDGSEGDDYIEAHASGPNNGAQICYSDGNDESSPGRQNVNVGHSDTGYCR